MPFRELDRSWRQDGLHRRSLSERLAGASRGAVFQGVWDFFGRLFTRRATFIQPALTPLPEPVASIGRNASPAALAHLIELFPDHRTIGVVDEHRALIAVLEVAPTKRRLALREVQTVAELI